MAKQRIIPIIYKVDYSQVDKSTASVRKAEQATDKLNKEIKKTETVGSRSFNILSNAIAATGIVALIGSVTKKIFELGVANEQTAIAFNTLTGSVQKGTQLLKELTKFSIETPFTPDQVNRAAKALLAFGLDAKKVIPTLKLLGDVASGTGKDLTEMAVIFGQIRSTGRLMGQDLLQLINAGFNPLQIISQKTGKSVAVLKKEMEKGLITFEMVEQSFKDATSAGGLFFNLMEKQSESIGGKMSTIEGNLEEIGKALFELNKGPIADFASVIVDITSDTQGFVDTTNSLVNALIPFYNAIKPIVDSLRSAADETERLRLEQLRLELILAKSDLDEGAGGAEGRIKLIQRIIELSKELGELPTGTTEDPLPWVTAGKSDDIYKVAKATEKLTESQKRARQEFLKMMGFTTAAEKVNEKEKEAKDLEKIETDANKRSLALQDYWDELKRKKAQEQRDYEYEQQEAQTERIRALQEEAFDFGISLIEGLLFANTDSYDRDSEALRDKYDRELLLAGDNERAKTQIELRRAEEEKKLRDKQLNDEKRQQTRRILIETVLNAVKALGLPPIPGANWLAAGKATAYGLLAAATARKYSKGSEVGIDGPGSTTSDSIPAMLSRNETVMSSAQTDSSRGILKAIKAKKLDDRLLEKLYKKAAGGDGVAFTDERIVNAIKNQPKTDYTKIGSYIYEVKTKNGNNREFIRKKYLS